MTSKAKAQVRVNTKAPTIERPYIKYVKKARMWCKTWFEGDKQHQEWSPEKPE